MITTNSAPLPSNAGALPVSEDKNDVSDSGQCKSSLEVAPCEEDNHVAETAHHEVILAAGDQKVVTVENGTACIDKNPSICESSVDTAHFSKESFVNNTHSKDTPSPDEPVTSTAEQSKKLSLPTSNNAAPCPSHGDDTSIKASCDIDSSKINLARSDSPVKHINTNNVEFPQIISSDSILEGCPNEKKTSAVLNTQGSLHFEEPRSASTSDHNSLSVEEETLGKKAIISCTNTAYPSNLHDSSLKDTSTGHSKIIQPSLFSSELAQTKEIQSLDSLKSSHSQIRSPTASQNLLEENSSKPRDPSSLSVKIKSGDHISVLDFDFTMLSNVDKLNQFACDNTPQETSVKLYTHEDDRSNHDSNSSPIHEKVQNSGDNNGCLTQSNEVPLGQNAHAGDDGDMEVVPESTAENEAGAKPCGKMGKAENQMEVQFAASTSSAREKEVVKMDESKRKDGTFNVSEEEVKLIELDSCESVSVKDRAEIAVVDYADTELKNAAANEILVDGHGSDEISNDDGHGSDEISNDDGHGSDEISNDEDSAMASESKEVQFEGCGMIEVLSASEAKKFDESIPEGISEVMISDDDEKMTTEPEGLHGKLEVEVCKQEKSIADEHVNSLSDTKMLTGEKVEDVTTLSDTKMLTDEKVEDVHSLSDTKMLNDEKVEDETSLSDTKMLTDEKVEDVNSLSGNKMLTDEKVEDVKSLSGNKMLTCEKVEDVTSLSDVKMLTDEKLEDETSPSDTKMLTDEKVEEMTSLCDTKMLTSEKVEDVTSLSDTKQSTGENVEDVTSLSDTKLSTGEKVEDVTSLSDTKLSTGENVEDVTSLSDTKLSTGENVEDVTSLSDTKLSTSEKVEDVTSLSDTKLSAGENVEDVTSLSDTKLSTSEKVEDVTSLSDTRLSTGENVEDVTSLSDTKPSTSEKVEDVTSLSDTKLSTGDKVENKISLSDTKIVTDSSTHMQKQEDIIKGIDKMSNSNSDHDLKVEKINFKDILKSKKDDTSLNHTKSDCNSNNNALDDSVVLIDDVDSNTKSPNGGNDRSDICVANIQSGHDSSTTLHATMSTEMSTEHQNRKRSLSSETETGPASSPKRTRVDSNIPSKPDGGQDKCLMDVDEHETVVLDSDDEMNGPEPSIPAPVKDKGQEKPDITLTRTALRGLILASLKSTVQGQKLLKTKMVEERMLKMESANTLWKESARHLEKSVEELTKYCKEIDKRKAQAQKLKHLSSCSIGIQTSLSQASAQVSAAQPLVAPVPPQAHRQPVPRARPSAQAVSQPPQPQHPARQEGHQPHKLTTKPHHRSATLSLPPSVLLNHTNQKPTPPTAPPWQPLVRTQAHSQRTSVRQPPPLQQQRPAASIPRQSYQYLQHQQQLQQHQNLHQPPSNQGPNRLSQPPRNTQNPSWNQRTPPSQYVRPPGANNLANQRNNTPAAAEVVNLIDLTDEDDNRGPSNHNPSASSSGRNVGQRDNSSSNHQHQSGRHPLLQTSPKNAPTSRATGHSNSNQGGLKATQANAARASAALRQGNNNPATGVHSTHPAPFPKEKNMRAVVPTTAKIPPPKPTLKISRVVKGIVLSWNMQSIPNMEVIASYQLFAYQESSAPAHNPSTAWKKVGDVKALPLPMACTLTQFQEGNKYFFAVRAVDQFGRWGDISDPSSIYLYPEGAAVPAGGAV